MHYENIRWISRLKINCRKFFCIGGILALSLGLTACDNFKTFFLSAEAEHALEREDMDTAIDRYQKLVNLNPKEPEYYFDLGYAYLQKGDFDNVDQVILKLDHLGQKEMATELQKYLRMYKYKSAEGKK